MSYGVLLCLGLSGNAALATDEMQPGHTPERIGGQAGYRGDEDKLKGVADDTSGMRIGGQAGYRGDEDKLKGVADDTSGMRIGGQAGYRGDEDKLQRGTMK